MKKITAGRDEMGEFAPKFAEINADVLFGEVWSREDKLSPRDRSLITISTLVGAGILSGPLESHLKMGKAHGITAEDQLVAKSSGLLFAWSHPDCKGTRHRACNVFI